MMGGVVQKKVYSCSQGERHAVGSYCNNHDLHVFFHMSNCEPTSAHSCILNSYFDKV